MDQKNVTNETNKTDKTVSLMGRWHVLEVLYVADVPLPPKGKL